MSRFIRSRFLRIGSIVLVVLVVSVAWAVCHWQSHLLWMAASGAHVRAIPVSQLHEPDGVQSWGRCDIGPLHFSIPRELAENSTRQARLDGLTGVEFETTEYRLVVCSPTNDDYYRRLESAMLSRFARPKQPATSFLAELYQTDSAQFRWSMSETELKELQQRIAFRQEFCSFSVRAVEVRVSYNVDCLIGGDSGRGCWCEWRSRSCGMAGLIVLDAKGGVVDTDWIRGIASTLEVDDDFDGFSDVQKLLASVRVSAPGNPEHDVQSVE